MKKSATLDVRNAKPTDALDWSYVELQEYDFLVNESQELPFNARENKGENDNF